LAAYYLDTSALVKRYVSEPGTAWVTGLLAPVARNRIHLAHITAVEVVAAIARRQRAGSLPAATAAALIAQLRRHFATRYRVVEIGPKVITQAVALAERYALRGYDAVQLAAAQQGASRRTARRLSPLTLVSSDAELNAAAALEGLAVDDPNLHP